MHAQNQTKTKMNKIFLLFLTLLVSSVLPTIAYGQSGSCGTDLTWTYDSSNRILTIKGTGAMTNYQDSSPWSSYTVNSVQLPYGLSTIGKNAFYKCALTTVEIPATVTSIAENAFRDCPSLASANIYGELTFIGGYAFNGCASLSYINMLGKTAPSLGSAVFDGCTVLTNINVPAGSIGVYAAAETWSSYTAKLKSNWTANQITSGDFAGYWTTYYNSGCAVTVDANTHIYYISSIKDNQTAVLTENKQDKVISKAQGVVLKSTAATVTLSYSAAQSQCSYTGQKLSGVDAETTISGSTYASKYIYTLTNVNGLGFYLYYSTSFTTNTKLAANKAFLPLDAAVASNAHGFVFSYGEVTGIEKVESRELRDERFYTLDGRKLDSKPRQSGMYIHKGKKFVVK